MPYLPPQAGAQAMPGLPPQANARRDTITNALMNNTNPPPQTLMPSAPQQQMTMPQMPPPGAPPLGAPVPQMGCAMAGPALPQVGAPSMPLSSGIPPQMPQGMPPSPTMAPQGVPLPR